MSKKRKKEEITFERLRKLSKRISRLKAKLREVNDSPFTKLRKAYVIFSQYPEIFGDVPLWKLKFLFYDEWEECTNDE